MDEVQRGILGSARRYAGLLDAGFDHHGLTFAFAALRQPGRQAFGKLFWCQAEARFDEAICDG